MFTCFTFCYCFLHLSLVLRVHCESLSLSLEATGSVGAPVSTRFSATKN